MSNEHFALASTDSLVFFCDPGVRVPQKSSPEDSGYDVFANRPATLYPGQTAVIDTQVAVVVPRGYELQVRSRSGNALKKGVFVLNSPGTIDQHYTGTIGVILHNSSAVVQQFGPEDRIAQLVLAPVCAPGRVETVETGVRTPQEAAAEYRRNLTGQMSSRGEKGFGSSG